MRGFPAIALAIASLLCSSQVSAGSVPSVASIQLGMSSATVLQRLHVAGLEPKSIVTRPCLSEYLAQHRARVAMSGVGHCLESIDAVYGGGDLLVFFTEDLPRHPGTSIASTIALNYPTDWSVVERLLHEVGKPTLVDGNHPWVLAMWCFETPCTDMNKVVGDRSSGPTLFVHRGIGFTLNDLHAATMREDYLNHELSAHHVVLDP